MLLRAVAGILPTAMWIRATAPTAGKSVSVTIAAARLIATMEEQGECPTVTIDTGKVKGSAARVLSSKRIFSFRNLPYGRPPTGRLRFMPPLPALPWQGVLDCSRETSIPMQHCESMKEMQYYTPTTSDLSTMEKKMSEDCLHLSIYTPGSFTNGKHPVMVWIYGGAFQMGFADSYDGSILAALHDVVVVIPNYRVGVFGFFSLGRDSHCKGNSGLLDQHLALQWVQRNIESFGGDKNNVTIFGESAGGCSVNHHVNSSMSSGLFHKAVSHSGQTTLAKIFKRDLTRARENFLDILDIEERDPSKLLDILQKIPARELAHADFQIQTRFMAFNPTIDGKFVTKDPVQSLRDGPVNKVPYIIGCNDSEGHGMLTLLANVPHFETGLTEKMCKVLLTNFLPRMSPSATEECQQACVDFYLKDRKDKYGYSKVYGDVYTDSMFVAPALTTAASAYNAGCQVYFYFATFQLRMNHDEKYGPGVGKKPHWCYCDHSDDILLMFGAPFVPGKLCGGAKFTDEERELSRKCMQYITNFAKTGNPNVGESVDVEWPLHAPGGKYIIIRHDVQVGENLLSENVKFWNETIFDIKKKHEMDENFVAKL